MGARSKSGMLRGLARKGPANAPGRPGRTEIASPEAWEQTAQIPDDRYDEIDCQRIVQGGEGRSQPRYFDDYS